MSAWSNDIPNPFTLGGSGVSGALWVYDAAGVLLATIDENGIQVYDAGNTVAIIDNFAISWIDVNGGTLPAGIDITTFPGYGALISLTPPSPGALVMNQAMIYATTFPAQNDAPVLVLQSPWEQTAHHDYARIYIIGEDSAANLAKIDFRTNGGPVSVLDGASLIVEGSITSGGYQALIGKRGTVTTGPTAVASFTQAVSFGVTFTSIPNVHINLNNGAGATAQWHGRAISVTTTGFTLFGFGPAVATFSAGWQWTAILGS